VWSKRFCSRTRQNGTNFGRGWKVEYKKSFKLEQQISQMLAKILPILHQQK
jgi:hypothetical protein